MHNWSVLLVDDHPLMRKGLAQLLRFDGGFSDIYEVDNGYKAIEFVNDCSVDLIILDLNMKGMSGLETLKQLKENGCESVIVALTVSDHGYDVEQMLAAGCDGYLLKDSDPDDILMQLKLAMQGQRVFSSSIVFIENKSSPLHYLTEREQQVLALVAQGLRNKEIANVLFISEATVKVHLKNVLKKLAVSSRVEASLFYLKQV